MENKYENVWFSAQFVLCVRLVVSHFQALIYGFSIFKFNPNYFSCPFEVSSNFLLNKKLSKENLPAPTNIIVKQSVA